MAQDVEQPASLPPRQPEEPNTYLWPGVALHTEAATPIDQQPVSIHPQHAPLDALRTPHRKLIAGTNVAHATRLPILWKRL